MLGVLATIYAAEIISCHICSMIDWQSHTDLIGKAMQGVIYVIFIYLTNCYIYKWLKIIAEQLPKLIGTAIAGLRTGYSATPM